MVECIIEAFNIRLITLIETISFSVNDTQPLSTFFMDGHIWKVEFTIYQVSLKGLDNDVAQVIVLPKMSVICLGIYRSLIPN